MEHVPSDEAIREMDGPALTLLAHKLGLAPERSIVYEHTTGQRGVVMFLPTRMAQWEPHIDIDHASAVLRHMRASGWWTIAEGGHDAGEVSLEYGHWEADNYTTFCCTWHPNGKETEPLAILRACVLARAHQHRTERSTQRDNLL